MSYELLVLLVIHAATLDTSVRRAGGVGVTL